MDVNITINVGEDGNTTVKQETGIKKKVRKLKNGKEVILEMPNATEDPNKPKNILSMLGI